MKKIKFFLTNRFVFFFLFLLLFVVINYLYTKQFWPGTSTKDLWFYSGLFMILFSILFIEPFYSTPKNVISNAIPLLLVYLSIKDSFINVTIWWISFTIISGLILLSIISMSLYNPSQSEDSLRNSISDKLRDFAVLFGQGKYIYSFVFISILFLYKLEIVKGTSESYWMALILLWGLILLINPQIIHNKFTSSETIVNGDALGDIFSVQSNKMFLVKLFEDRKSVKKFDIVKFRYIMDDESSRIKKGLVFDTYNLNKEKWAKVIILKEENEPNSELKSNTVFKVTDLKEKGVLEKELQVEQFVGVVIEGSRIGSIKFEYSKKKNDIQEGDLLELYVGEKKIFYQIMGGVTAFEKLESKDESGFIEGEAIQLGIWKNEELSFEKFGWLPEINTPLFRAKTDDIQVLEFTLPEYKLGVIPNTKLPSVINLNEAISHHIALLGVTGSGKSYLALELIRHLIKETNVICIDFTGEYKTALNGMEPKDLIKTEGLKALEKTFSEKHEKALAKKPSEELELKKKIQAQLDEYVKDFIVGAGNLGIFELPALSNTSFILEFTQFFIESVFNYAKTNLGNKICLVLEEAHTIVPETGFLGDLGDYGSTKALVNKMAQIALQGRKYGVGLMVIAQRTANVSKTVLTQCNTIICFQAYDETSFTFLGNYIGKDLVQTLPNLKKYHAIVTGKAIKSKIPMIVNLER